MSLTTKLVPLCAAVAFCLPSFTQAATEVDGIAAVINGEPITKSEVRKAAQVQIHLFLVQNPRMTQGALAAKVKEIEQKALQDLIEKQLILDEFNSRGATIQEQHVTDAVNRFIRERFEGNREKFLEELNNQQISMVQFRDIQKENLVVQAMRSMNSGPRDMIVTPKEREDFWRDNPDLFSSDGYVKLRTITIPKLANNDPSTADAQRQLVNDILSKLQGGADFGAMARTYSMDAGRDDGGIRGTFSRTDLNDVLANAAFSIEPRTVSNIIDLGDFYTLIYVDARELGKVTPLEEVEDEVHRYVIQNKRQEAFERWMDGLRQKANVRILDDNLLSMQ